MLKNSSSNLTLSDLTLVSPYNKLFVLHVWYTYIILYHTMSLPSLDKNGHHGIMKILI